MHLNRRKLRMRLTCPAVRHHEEQPTLGGQQPEPVPPQHASSLPCLPAVYSANDATKAALSIPWSLSDGQGHSSHDYAMRQVPGVPQHFLPGRPPRNNVD